MKTATISELKKELKYKSQEQLLEYCLAMARFKKESKELLTYLVFESEHEDVYVKSVKQYMDEQFTQINTTSYYFIKKSVRKILRQVKRYIRYSKQKETEVELLLYFCNKLQESKPDIFKNKVLTNMYNTQMRLAKKAVTKLHPDLQYDYKEVL
jgi:vacuolar-type H+-ATPase catalytic subunit A/Vma1